LNLFVIKLFATGILMAVFFGCWLAMAEVNHPRWVNPLRALLTASCVFSMGVALYWLWTTIPNQLTK
jgi:hypothetical protein